METEKSDNLLVEGGFSPEQIESLRRLRHLYIGREFVQITQEQRRLEFARWLVSTGRLTDMLPEMSRV